MAAQRADDAYVTLLLSDNYLPGALVLAHSLRDAGTTKRLAVLVTLDSVSAEVITQLKAVFDDVIPVPRIRNAKPANLYLMNRADLHSAFTKINLWKQTQYRKIVYLDADVVACRAVDELFDLKHDFSAAPDVGWPDLFNTGVMALTPNMGDYYAMMAMAERGISFDGADQGLLNMHFKNSYNRLSFTYNVTPSAHYSYVPAYKHFQSSINIVHFIGSEKPWAQGRSASVVGDSPYAEMLGRWWAVYDRHYRQPSPPPSPARDSQDDQHSKVPEIVQYFVKGEFQPPSVTYVVPTGEPPLHEGRSTNVAYHYASSSTQSDHKHVGQHQPHHDQSDQFHFTQSVPSGSLHVEGLEAEAGKEQFSGPSEGAPPVQHEEKEHKPEPPPMQPTWDAQRQAPSADSKPEAVNFPQIHYEMSSDVAPFVPPQRYPSPPRNMWYEVPKEKPAPPTEKPPPIFPWESQQPKPTRVFADEVHPSEPEPAPSMTEASTVATSDTSGRDEPPTPTIKIVPSDPWASFTRINAWDDDPAIEKYIDAMPLFRRHRSQGSIAEKDVLDAAAGDDSAARSQKDTSAGAEWRRRGSKLTDFPTAVDRPSLPVTPAPIRRPKFWGAGDPGPGDEDEDDDALPAADGVPKQSDWVCEHGRRYRPGDCLCNLTNLFRFYKDPVARLQLLQKQQSELLLQKLGNVQAAEDEGTGGSIGIEGHDIPKRSLPFGSESVISPSYVPKSAPVHSPQPLKPPGVRPRGILDGSIEEAGATPRTTTPTSKGTQATTGSGIPEVSYHGPGAAWEKGEGYSQRSTAMPPSEEEKDVLET
ncbi:glycogenin glucosyltransferase [Gnomoniopsis smithogilvyi]|uniref:glycogenin glucosyltransferase n=1 Tax=Gnomoniopsis smithogilvyi TaxID=1191159 RepID=A0A9W8YP97_9PEZI|nr:glycogenin glucosyltransferase [Gnomoniopsis smithogilvyi]